MPAVQLIGMMRTFQSLLFPESQAFSSNKVYPLPVTRRGAETVTVTDEPAATAHATPEHENLNPFSREFWSMPGRYASSGKIAVLVFSILFFSMSLGSCIVWCAESWHRSCRRRRRKKLRPKLLPADRVDWEKKKNERHIFVRFVTALPGWILRWVVVRPVYRICFVIWFPIGFLLVFFVGWWLYPFWRKIWSGKRDKVGTPRQLEQHGGTGHDDEGGDILAGFGGRRYRILTKHEYRRQLRALLMWSFRGKHNHGAAGSLDGDCYFDELDAPEREPSAMYNLSYTKWVIGPNGEAIPPRGKIPPRRRPRSPSPPRVIGQPEQPQPRAEDGQDGGQDGDPAEVRTPPMVWVNLSRSKWKAGPNGDAIPPGGGIPTAGEALKCTSWRGAQRVPWEVVNLVGITTHLSSPTFDCTESYGCLTSFFLCLY